MSGHESFQAADQCFPTWGRNSPLVGGGGGWKFKYIYILLFHNFVDYYTGGGVEVVWDVSKSQVLKWGMIQERLRNTAVERVRGEV